MLFETSTSDKRINLSISKSPAIARLLVRVPVPIVLALVSDHRSLRTQLFLHKRPIVGRGFLPSGAGAPVV